MDLFPIVLPQRDLQRLIYYLSEWDDLDPLGSLRNVEGPEEMADKILTMSSRQMSILLNEVEAALLSEYRDLGRSVREYREEAEIEGLGEMRKEIAFIQGLKRRIRRPR